MTSRLFACLFVSAAVVLAGAPTARASESLSPSITGVVRDAGGSPRSLALVADAEGHTISGRVTDETGKPIARAIVRVVEIQRSMTTRDDGSYSLTQIASGKYTISFALIGYAPQVSRVVVATADVTVNATLKHSMVELAAMQISASAKATSTLNSPQPVIEINEEDLMKVRPTSLGDALGQLAGMRNNSSGEAAGKPVIRGLTNNRVLVLDNGQRLEHNTWGDDHFSSVEPAASSRIEVIRGPASVLYGSDAIGGVINVIEPDLPDGIGRTPFTRGSVTGGYASGNRQNDATLMMEGANGGFGYRGSFTDRSADNTKTPTYTLWNSGYHNLGGTGTLGYRGGWGSLTGRYSYRNDRLNLTDEDPTATGRAGTDDSRGRVELALPMGDSRLEWNAGYQLNRRHEWEDAAATSEAFGMKQTTYTTEARLHHPSIGAFGGLIGVAGEYTTDANFGEEFLEPDNKTSDGALFFFEQGDVGRWGISFGGRYDYRHLDADANAVIGNPAASRSWSSLTGSVGFVFHVTEPVALVLNVARGFRSPSAFDLFSNGLHEATSTFEHGNPNLNTETSLNSDLGLRIQTGSLTAEVGGFVNKIQDFIYTVPSNQVDPESGFEIYNVVQGDAQLTGFEAQVEYHPFNYLHLQGSADYVSGQNQSSGDPLPSMPPFRATYLARLEGESFGALSNPYFSVGGETNAQQTRLNPAEVTFYAGALGGQGYRSSSYSLVNLAAGFSVGGRGAQTLQFDFQLRNLFDQAYVSYLSHLKTLVPNPGMGRNLIARVTAKF